MLPSLVAHAVGYEMVVGAHNTIDVQMHVAGFTVFALYIKCQRLQHCLDKCRHPQHCLGPDMPGRLLCAYKAWPGGTVLQVRRVW